jgi:hypothetical protein
VYQRLLIQASLLDCLFLVFISLVTAQLFQKSKCLSRVLASFPARNRRRNLQHVLTATGTLFLVIGLLPGPVAAADSEVITKGRLRGSVTAIPVEASDSRFRVESVATGTLSHVGRVTLTWAVPAVELDLVQRQLIVPDPVWRGTLTTPNGDQIFWEYEFPDPVFTFTSLGDLPFLAVADATGGTGRFEHVSGHAMAIGTANIFTGKFRVDFIGLGGLFR